MKQTREIMGMPITVEIVDKTVKEADSAQIFDYFTYVDTTFSTYKASSEMSRINYGTLQKKQASRDMQTVLALCEQTNKDTNGYFNILHKGTYDPSGLVKGWAIQNAAKILQHNGFKNFYIEAGGDIQVSGKNNNGHPWSVGIRNPFNKEEIIKVLMMEDQAVATSGTYIRGQHIYNPYQRDKKLDDIVSFTVIGQTIYDADRFATAAFAMGEKGIQFIASMPGFEGYMIDKNGMATYTNGFERYVI